MNVYLMKLYSSFRGHLRAGAGLILFLLFFALPPACPCGGTGHRASPGALLLQQELV